MDHTIFFFLLVLSLNPQHENIIFICIKNKPMVAKKNDTNQAYFMKLIYKPLLVLINWHISFKP